MTDIEVQHAAVSAPEPAQLDVVLSGAIELARAAAVEVGGEHVGEHVGEQAEGERLVTHGFASTLPGYVGWYWAVSLVRAPRAKVATVADVVLLPGAGALLATEWVPWNERLRPGDLSPGDLLPPDPADSRLVPAYTLSDDPAVEATAFELGMGRERVMSREGRLDAADRWYAGDAGPDSPMARQAPAPCGTCGFLLPLAGSLQAGFGVCGNEISATDGRVVSIEYGCGAHSQAKVVVPALSEPMGEVYDDGDDITLNPVAIGSDSAPTAELDGVESAETVELDSVESAETVELDAVESETAESETVELDSVEPQLDEPA